jgi:hypothetical protein
LIGALALPLLHRRLDLPGDVDALGMRLARVRAREGPYGPRRAPLPL